MFSETRGPVLRCARQRCPFDLRLYGLSTIGLGKRRFPRLRFRFLCHCFAWFYPSVIHLLSTRKVRRFCTLSLCPGLHALLQKCAICGMSLYPPWTAVRRPRLWGSACSFHNLTNLSGEVGFTKYEGDGSSFRKRNYVFLRNLLGFFNQSEPTL